MSLGNKKFNVLFYHPTGLFFGSTEKFLQTVAKHSDKNKFNVFFLYSDKKFGAPRLSYFQNSDVTLIKFDYKRMLEREPFTIFGMKPHILDVINRHKIDCVILAVSSNYHFPINVIPATMPLVLVSPFGHYSTNGNVFKVYCSGNENKKRIERRGGRNVALLYNPLEEPTERYKIKPPIGEIVVFGRIGRPDDNIFDPIVIKAFKKLEDFYGAKVRYEVVAPPPAMITLTQQLGIKNINFQEPISDDTKLAQFYNKIDVFAHARVDGETMGIAIAEAMMAGNPIITHKSRYHNEHLSFLELSFARWCDVDDVEGYFQNMKWFVENKAKIREMGILAQKKAQLLFDIKNFMSSFNRELELACLTSTYWERFGRLRGNFILFFANSKALPKSIVRRIILGTPFLRRHLEFFKKFSV